MSLNWNAEKVPEETRTIVATADDRMRGIKAGDRILNPVTETLVFSTMAIGIGVIDENTVDEFAARIDFYQRLNGALMLAWPEGSDQPEPKFLTREDVVAHMGLSTNVFPMERRTSWVKRMTQTSPPFEGVAEPKYR